MTKWRVKVKSPEQTAQHLASVDHIRNNPKFAELVAKRTVFAWTLSVIILVMYFGFIGIIAFDKTMLAAPLVAGSVTTIGFPIGVGVILASIILTGIYVYRANGEFDEINRQIIEESR
jgi:uncharacterized membrane protein (DUF485 family)